MYIATTYSKPSDKNTGNPAAVPGRGDGDGGVYEDPDKPAHSTGKGDYELTQCPAYESTTRKLQTEAQSSHYEM